MKLQTIRNTQANKQANGNGMFTQQGKRDTNRRTKHEQQKSETYFLLPKIGIKTEAKQVPPVGS